MASLNIAFAPNGGHIDTNIRIILETSTPDILLVYGVPRKVGVAEDKAIELFPKKNQNTNTPPPLTPSEQVILPGFTTLFSTYFFTTIPDEEDVCVIAWHKRLPVFDFERQFSQNALYSYVNLRFPDGEIELTCYPGREGETLAADPPILYQLATLVEEIKLRKIWLEKAIVRQRDVDPKVVRLFITRSSANATAHYAAGWHKTVKTVPEWTMATEGHDPKVSHTSQSQWADSSRRAISFGVNCTGITGTATPITPDNDGLITATFRVPFAIPRGGHIASNATEVSQELREKFYEKMLLRGYVKDVADARARQDADRGDDARPPPPTPDGKPPVPRPHVDAFGDPMLGPG